MSAPPPGAPGRPPPGPGQPLARPKPNTNPLRPMRRRPADPMVSRKPKPGPRPSVPARPIGGASLGLNPHGEATTLAQLEQRRKQYGGWSEPPPAAQYRDFPIVTTGKALKDGIRHHIMRFSQSKVAQESKPIDPGDQETFTRPVTLHRRDPRQPPPGRQAPSDEDTMSMNTVDDKEAERQQQIKEEREAQKAIDQAKIAPSVKEANSKKPKKVKQEKISFNYMPKTEKGIKEAELRYEEALPWHLEDVDGKNVWVGSYVSALSETNVAFVIDGPRFRMVPLEKWYKFTAKPTFERIPEDKIEQYMKKEVSLGRWAMQAMDKENEEKRLKDEFRNFGRRRPAARVANAAAEVRGYDEVDMEGDEFDDDDENPGFDNEDEDAKMSNERIRANMLGANLFGEANENEVDAQEEARLRRETERREATRKLKKTFIKRDDTNDIESDDSLFSGDPFASSSEDEDDEEEDETNSKPEEEEKAKSQSASGVNPKGATTPSGKRQADPLKGNKLKRPGSPNLSESSGNESTLRRRLKKKSDATGHSRSTTPMAQGQPLSGQAGQRRKMAAGLTSDGEATAGEMSDGQPRKKKIKLIPTSGKGTPVGSRAGSPLPVMTKDGQNHSRSGPKSTIEAWEIVQALPQLPDGITIGNFLKLFEARVGDKADGKMPKSDWIKLVKENCSYGPDKLLRRKA